LKTSTDSLRSRSHFFVVLRKMQSTLTQYNDDEATIHGCVELLLDCLHVYDSPFVRGLQDVGFQELYDRARHSFYLVLVAYYHLLALHELGSAVYAFDTRKEGSAPFNLRSAFNNVRLLLALYYRLIFYFQNELYRRNLRIVTERGVEELDDCEMRWLFKDYSRWCQRYVFTTQAADKPLLLSLMEDVERWNITDVQHMCVIDVQLQVIKRMMKYDVDLILHVSKPIDMPGKQYPTMELLNYYDTRMRERDVE